MEELKIINLKVADLVPYVNNPRKNDQAVKAVASSIKQFGFKVPITVDKDHVIVTGHTRLKAALQLGMVEVPVIVLDDLTPEKVKAFRLVDNKVGEIAEWDFDALDIELEGIHDIDMSEFEFEIAGTDADDVEEDEYDQEPPKDPVSKPGEVYVLGKHRIMCGSATSERDMEILMDSTEADCYITDPPYNVNYKGANSVAADVNKEIANDNMDEESFVQFLTDAFQTANDALKPGGSFYIWHSDSHGLSFRNAAKDVGLEIRQCLIWRKNALVLGRQDYQWIHEPCLYGWKDGAAHYFINDRSLTTVIEDEINIGKLKLAEAKDIIRKLLSPKTPVSIIEENKPSKSTEHPTMKPVRLMGRIMANSTKKGQVVLDNFGGSGSTLMAAEQLGRSCYTMELEPKYIDVIINRWEKFTGEKAIRVREGDDSNES